MEYYLVIRKAVEMKKRKTVFHIVLLLLFWHGWINSAHAAENVEITATTAEGQEGDIVEVSFIMENNPGTTMYELYIEYDTEALEVVSAEGGGGYPEWFDTDVTISPLYISAGDALSLKNIKECHTLTTVCFKIKDLTAAGEYRFGVKGLFLNADLDEFEVVYKDTGCITVTAPKNQLNEEDTVHNSENISEKDSIQTSDDFDTKGMNDINNTNHTDSKDNESNSSDNQNSQDMLENADSINKDSNRVKESDNLSADNTNAEKNYEEVKKKQTENIFQIIILLIVFTGIVGGTIYYKKRK